MTDDKTTEIDPGDVDWDGAVVREGRQPATVVSVRLSPDEAVRLRVHADALGVTVSEVLGRRSPRLSPGRRREASRMSSRHSRTVQALWRPKTFGHIRVFSSFGRLTGSPGPAGHPMFHRTDSDCRTSHH